MIEKEDKNEHTSEEQEPKPETKFRLPVWNS